MITIEKRRYLVVKTKYRQFYVALLVLLETTLLGALFLYQNLDQFSSKDPFQNLANILPTERQLDIVCYYTRNTHHIIFVF